MNLQLQLNCCKRVVRDVKSSHEMLVWIWETFCWGTVDGTEGGGTVQ